MPHPAPPSPAPARSRIRVQPASSSRSSSPTSPRTRSNGSPTGSSTWPASPAIEARRCTRSTQRRERLMDGIQMFSLHHQHQVVLFQKFKRNRTGDVRAQVQSARRRGAERGQCRGRALQRPHSGRADLPGRFLPLAPDHLLEERLRQRRAELVGGAHKQNTFHPHPVTFPHSIRYLVIRTGDAITGGMCPRPKQLLSAVRVGIDREDREPPPPGQMARRVRSG